MYLARRWRHNIPAKNAAMKKQAKYTKHFA